MPEKLFKMKFPALLLALASLLSFSFNVTAQQRFTPRKTQSAPEQRFSVGFAPFSVLLPSGKVNLHGEWAYSANKSVSLLLGIPRPTTAPGFIANNVDLDEEGDVTTNRYTSFSAIVEHRFYLGQNAPRGFYLAPYTRYNNFGITRTTINADNQYETTVKGTIGGLGLGAAAGVQFKLGDFLTLDATLAGVDFKWMRGTLTYSTDDPENDVAAFRNKVQEAVGDIPFIGSKLTPQIDGNAVKVRTPGVLMPGYRFNLTLNYLF